jgi:site-specific recombinase XerD
MNALADALKKYLQLRRNLGSKLQGVDRPLRDFVAFAKREHSSHITTDLALRWAQQPVHVQPVTWASRLRLVRGFALWLSATDPCTEVPPAGLLPYRYQRQPPYIYSDAQIAAIVRAAGRLVSPKGLRGRTYSTIFGLLSVSGMRVSEALALDRQDVDLEQGILHVRGTAGADTSTRGAGVEPAALRTEHARRLSGPGPSPTLRRRASAPRSSFHPEVSRWRSVKSA